MNLSHLVYFRKLAQHQHYTRTADELYITQPTLSNAIARLEEELGVPLFEKVGRNVRLTRYGREYVRYVNRALRLLDEGKEAVEQLAGKLGGAISIGTIYTIQDQYIPALLNHYRKECGGDTELNIYQGLTLPLIDGLEKGDYDVVFCAHVADKSNIAFHPVLSQDFKALVHKDSPLAKYESISLSSLVSSHLVSYRDATPVGGGVSMPSSMSMGYVHTKPAMTKLRLHQLLTPAQMRLVFVSIP